MCRVGVGSSVSVGATARMPAPAPQPHTRLGFVSGTNGFIECIIELKQTKCPQMS